MLNITLCQKIVIGFNSEYDRLEFGAVLMNIIARQFEVSSAEAHHYKVVIINVSHIIMYMDSAPSYMPKLIFSKNSVCLCVCPCLLHMY